MRQNEACAEESSSGSSDPRDSRQRPWGREYLLSVHWPKCSGGSARVRGIRPREPWSVLGPPAAVRSRSAQAPTHLVDRLPDPQARTQAAGPTRMVGMRRLRSRRRVPTRAPGSRLVSAVCDGGCGALLAVPSCRKTHAVRVASQWFPFVPSHSAVAATAAIPGRGGRLKHPPWPWLVSGPEGPARRPPRRPGSGPPTNASPDAHSADPEDKHTRSPRASCRSAPPW